jgi:hypothetical protein
MTSSSKFAGSVYHFPERFQKLSRLAFVLEPVPDLFPGRCHISPDRPPGAWRDVRLLSELIARPFWPACLAPILRHLSTEPESGRRRDSPAIGTAALHAICSRPSTAMYGKPSSLSSHISMFREFSKHGNDQIDQIESGILVIEMVALMGVTKKQGQDRCSNPVHGIKRIKDEPIGSRHK